MTRVLSICKSEFIHEDEHYEPGDPIHLPTEESVDDRRKSSASMRDVNLVSAPDPSLQARVTPSRESEEHYVVAQGGGWYDVITSDGVVIDTSIRSRDSAEEKIADLVAEREEENDDTQSNSE